MKVLVTGATGFIGSHLSKRLLEDGHIVTLIVRNKNKLDKELQKNCLVVTADLLEREPVEKSLQGIEIVFNLAGNVKTWDSMDNYYSANVTAVENLLNGVIKNRNSIRKVIHCSTVDVYAYTNTECSETDLADGGCYGYGKTKAIGEKILINELSNANIPYTVIRPTNVIGPGSQFIKEIGNHYKSGFMIKINGGKVDAGLIYIDNLLDYVIWCAGSEKANGEIYNLCENNEITWNTFLKEFKLRIKAKAIDFNFPYAIAKSLAILCESVNKITGSSKEPLLHRLIVDMFGKTCNHSAAKIREHSKIIPRIKFQEAIDNSIEFFLEEEKR